jgi:hypothetical protein
VQSAQNSPRAALVSARPAKLDAVPSSSTRNAGWISLVASSSVTIGPNSRSGIGSHAKRARSE